VQTVCVQGLDVWSIRTQTVFGDDELEVGMILAQLGYKALGGITFTIILVRAITVDHRLRHERNDGPLVRMDDRGAQQLMKIGDRPIAVDFVQTGGTVNGLGGKIFCPIERQQIVPIKKCHRFKRLATLELPKDALEYRAEPLGGDGVKYLAHVGVTRNPRHPVDGVQIALDPLLVKGEERGRFEGKHRERGHQRIR
jgi:hypothetical protein